MSIARDLGDVVGARAGVRKTQQAEWRRLPRPMAGRTLLEQDGAMSLLKVGGGDGVAGCGGAGEGLPAFGSGEGAPHAPRSADAKSTATD